MTENITSSKPVGEIPPEKSKLSHKKIIVAAVAVLVVGGVAFASNSLGLFQGNIFGKKVNNSVSVNKESTKLNPVFNFIAPNVKRLVYGQFEKNNEKIAINTVENLDRTFFKGNITRSLGADSVKTIANSLSNNSILLAQYNEGVILVVKDTGVTTLSDDNRVKVPRKSKVTRKKTTPTSKINEADPVIKNEQRSDVANSRTSEQPSAVEKCDTICTKKIGGYLLVADNAKVLSDSIAHYQKQKIELPEQVKMFMQRAIATDVLILNYTAKDQALVGYKGQADVEAHMLNMFGDLKATSQPQTTSNTQTSTKADSDAKAAEPAKVTYDDPFMQALDAMQITAKPEMDKGNSIISQVGSQATVLEVKVPGYIYKKPEGGYLNVYADVSVCASKEMTGCQPITAGLIQSDLSAHVSANSLSQLVYNFGLVDNDEFTLQVSLTDVITKTRTVYKTGKYKVKILEAVTNEPATNTDTSIPDESSKTDESSNTNDVVKVVPNTEVSNADVTMPVIGDVSILEVYDAGDGEVLYHESLGGAAHPAVKLKFTFTSGDVKEGKSTMLNINVCSGAQASNCYSAKTFFANLQNSAIEAVLNKEDLYYAITKIDHQDGDDIYFTVSPGSQIADDNSSYQFKLNKSGTKKARLQTENDLVTVTGFADKYDPLDNVLASATHLDPSPSDKEKGHGPHQLSAYNYDTKDYFQIAVQKGQSYTFRIDDMSTSTALEVINNQGACSFSGEYTLADKNLTYQAPADGTFCFVYKTVQPTNTSYTLYYQVIKAVEEADVAKENQ